MQQGGYGTPPGGGFPPPAQGPMGGSPMGGPPMGGSPMGSPPTPPLGGPPAGNAGFGSFVGPALIGGVLGGLLSSIPILNLLNCVFCLLNVAGAMVAVYSWMGRNTGQQLSTGNAAIVGGMAGGVAGAMAGVLGTLIGLALSGVLVAMMSAAGEAIPPEVASRIAGQGLKGILYTPGYIVFYAAFGALGGMGCLHLFFKDRVAS